MKIYKVEISERHGFHPYTYTNDIVIIEQCYFSTKEKAETYISNKGFLFSPVVILCGTKIIRVCKDKKEANDLLDATKIIELRDAFWANPAEYEGKWVAPDSIFKINLDDCSTGVYAEIEEIEVM